jgi:5-methylthioadenosine/S-adenosylhomocysteine deaminase
MEVPMNQNELKKVDLVVKARAVITPRADSKIEVFEPGYLAIDKGKVVAVGSASKEYSYRGKVFHSFPEHVIVPGLVNAHTHSPMVLFRGVADDLPLKEWLEQHIWPLEGKFVSPEFVYEGSLLGCAEMALNGVTFFSDMYFAMDKVAEAAKRVGIKAQIGEGILEFPTPTSPTVEHAFERTLNLIEQFKTDDFIFPVVAPHAPYTTSEKTLKRAAEMAASYDVSLHIHLAEEKWELEQFKNEKGISSIKYLDEIGFLQNGNVIAAHVNWLDEGDLEIIASSNVGVAHNPRSNMKLATGICPVSQMLNAGIAVGLGTDGASSNNRLSVLDEAQTAALLHKINLKDPTVVSAREAFLMATLYGARALKVESRIGSLEPGKDADFIAINFNRVHLLPCFDYLSHLIYAVRSSDIEFVFVNGKPVVFEGRLVNVDIEELKEIANKYADKIVKEKKA